MQRAILPLVVVFAAAVVAGCGSPPRLTESQEYFVGRGVAANQVLSSQGLVTEEVLNDYLNSVGQSIALESDRPETFKGYHFGILKSETVNAFAAPGGFVFVTTGALRSMQSEDELAGVIAHEIAHVNLRHPEEAANRETQKQGIMDILAKGGHLAEAGGGFLSGLLAATGHQQEAAIVKTVAENLAKVVKAFGNIVEGPLKELMVNGYGRESELQADVLAVDFLTRPGVRYDPNGLKNFIGRLPPAQRGAWSDHPELKGRVQNLEQAIQKKGVRTAADPERTKRFLAMKLALGL